MEITAKKHGPKGYIYINSTLHLFVRIDSLIGIQSWISYDKSIIDIFKIELYYKNTSPILLEYNTKEKWEQIISKLEQLMLPYETI